MSVVIIHDTGKWVTRIRELLSARGVRVEEWISDETSIDLSQRPPDGVIFYNRTTASSSTRGHLYSLEQARAINRWLVAHGKTIINGLPAIEFDDSKTWQYILANKHGITVPKSIATTQLSKNLIVRHFGESVPVIVKPDRGGFGTDVKKYESAADFESDAEPRNSPNGVFIVQEYIPNTGGVYRAEFVGFRHMYTTHALPTTCDNGVFVANMCPCDITKDRIKILEHFDHPVLERFEAFMRASGLEIGSFEFILNESQVPVVVDINTNTSFNESLEQETGLSRGGYSQIVDYICKKMEDI